MDKQLRCCELCSAEYKPCKQNYSRQKYCRSKACKRQRTKLRNEAFRTKNPTYYKELYKAQKTSKVEPPKDPMGVKSQAERVFANTSKIDNITQVIDIQLAIIYGMAVYEGGGLTQTPISGLTEIIKRCYEVGSSLFEAASIPNLLEISNESSNSALGASPET